MVAVDAKTMQTQPKAVSLRRNRVLSDLDAVYYMGRSRTNYVMMIISIYSIRKGPPDDVAILEM